MKFQIFIFTIIISLENIIGLNILALFPHPGASHFLFFKPLLENLCYKGHSITVVSYFPNEKKIENYTDIQIIGLPTMKEFIDLQVFENGYVPSPFESFFMIHSWGLESLEVALKSEAIEKVLKSNISYDILLIEQFNNDGMMAISHILNIPVVALTSSPMLPWHFNLIGTPFITSFMPDIFLGYSENMNLMKRIENWFYYHVINLMYNYVTQGATNKIIRKYLGNSLPDIDEISKKNTVLMLINQHYSLSGTKPYMPNVIEIGGLQIEESKPINPDIQKILDSAKSGVIYINWGSMIRSSTISVTKRDAIIKAISRLDQIVLWKWENDTLPNQSKNIHIRKWMQQRDILCHPNIKVFMNHGGLLGSSEAAFCGVPVIVTPIFGDQYLNAAALEYRGIATILKYNDINEDNVYGAIKKSLSLELQKNAKNVQYSFQNRPLKPMKLAIWWIEHIANTKGLLINSNRKNLSWFSYYLFDVYLIVITIILIFFIMFIYLFKKLIQKFILHQQEKIKIN